MAVAAEVAQQPPEGLAENTAAAAAVLVIRSAATAGSMVAAAVAAVAPVVTGLPGGLVEPMAATEATVEEAAPWNPAKTA